MKSLIIGAALAAAAFPALAQSNVSISIGQPGFYGRIDIGDYAPPPVYVAQPIIVERHPRYEARPVYLRVPPGHRKHWAKHCAQYGACGQQVYFVRDEWYTNTYAPRWRGEHHDRDYRDYRGDGERGDHRDYRDERRDDDRHGHGHENGRGHGHGHGHGHD